jgi:hypothetical protein
MNNQGKIIKPSSSASSANGNRGGLIDWVTQYDSLVVFGGLGLMIFLTVLYTGLFQAGPIVRTNVLFNAAMAMIMSGAFIWVIFHFMGAKLVIFGYPIDIGMIIYITIVFFVMFVLGN